MKPARLIATLNSIGALIDGLIAELEEDAGEQSDECAHPIEQRDDLTTMGGPEGWRCRVCGYSTLPDEETSTEETPTEESDNVSNSR